MGSTQPAPIRRRHTRLLLPPRACLLTALLVALTTRLSTPPSYRWRRSPRHTGAPLSELRRAGVPRRQHCFGPTPLRGGCSPLTYTDLGLLGLLDLCVLTGKGQRIRGLIQNMEAGARLSENISADPDLLREALRIATSVAEGNIHLLFSLGAAQKSFNAIGNIERAFRDYRMENGKLSPLGHAVAVWIAGGLILGFRRENYLSPNPRWNLQPPAAHRAFTFKNISKRADGRYNLEDLITVLNPGMDCGDYSKFNKIWMLSTAAELLHLVSRDIDKDTGVSLGLFIWKSRLYAEAAKVLGERHDSDGFRSAKGATPLLQKSFSWLQSAVSMARRLMLTKELGGLKSPGTLQKRISEIFQELNLRLSLEAFEKRKFLRSSNEKCKTLLSDCFNIAGFRLNYTGILGNGTKYQKDENAFLTLIPERCEDALDNPDALEASFDSVNLFMPHVDLDYSVNANSSIDEETIADRSVLAPEVFIHDDHVHDRPQLRDHDPEQICPLNDLQSSVLLVAACMMAVDPGYGEIGSLETVDHYGHHNFFSMAALRAVLDYNKDNWLVRSCALYERTRIQFDEIEHHDQVGEQLYRLKLQQERAHSRGVRRILDSQFARTAFLISPPLKWELNKWYGGSQLQNLNLNESFKVFKENGLYEEAITCLLLLRDRDAARELIQQRLLVKRTPLLLSMLADATNNQTYLNDSYEQSNRTFARPLFSLADHCIESKEYERARDMLKAGLRLDNRDISADRWYQLGYVYEELNDTENAVKAYRRCVKFNSEFLQAWTNMGVLLAQQRRFVDATNSMKRACKLKPNDWRLWQNLQKIALDARMLSDVCYAISSCATLTDGPIDLRVLANVTEAMKKNERDATDTPCQHYYPSLGHAYKALLKPCVNVTNFWGLYIKYLQCDYRGPPDSKVIQEAVEGQLRAQLLEPGFANNETQFLKSMGALAELAQNYINSGDIHKLRRALTLVRSMYYQSEENFKGSPAFENLEMVRTRLECMNLFSEEDSD